MELLALACVLKRSISIGLRPTDDGTLAYRISELAVHPDLDTCILEAIESLKADRSLQINEYKNSIARWQTELDKLEQAVIS